MKKPTYKSLLSSVDTQSPANSPELRDDVNEILDKVAKEDSFLALARERTAASSSTASGEDRSTDQLLDVLRNGLRSI